MFNSINASALEIYGQKNVENGKETAIICTMRMICTMPIQKVTSTEISYMNSENEVCLSCCRS